MLPDVLQASRLLLRVDLIHGSTPVRTILRKYAISPRTLLTSPVVGGARAGFAGAPADGAMVSALVPGIRPIVSIDAASLEDLDLLVIGPGCGQDPRSTQAAMRGFVGRGGFLLVLEQSRFTPGDIALATRSFPRAFMTDPAHPVFAGLADADLDAWHPGQPLGP